MIRQYRKITNQHIDPFNWFPRRISKSLRTSDAKYNKSDMKSFYRTLHASTEKKTTILYISYIEDKKKNQEHI